MAITLALPTRNPRSGFCAAAARNGYEVASVWARASAAFARVFAVTPSEVRDVLDGEAGRLLAQDLPFIEGGPASIEAIETLIRVRLCHAGWQRLYEQAIADVRAPGDTRDAASWPRATTRGRRRRSSSHTSID